MHVTARIAWHNNGWNGHICNDPQKNTFCVGSNSYPGDMISERRDLDWEKGESCAGKACSSIDGIPPCIYSINAFGNDNLTSFADPPEFFNKEALRKEWELPPATVCVWPYEEMYRDEVRGTHGYDNDKRLEFANQFFQKIVPNVSLVFYYANYSNPLSTDEKPRYVLVGLSRVSKVGELMYYEGCNEETRRKFGGGYVWDRNLSSFYPDQGLRLPYHLYQNDPCLDSFALFPEDPVQCKYGSKLLNDDQALGLVEQFLQSVCVLQQIGDTSEDWSLRRAWLESLIAELWKRRGAFPGLPAICDYLKFGEAIPFFKEQVSLGNELAAATSIWAAIEGKSSTLGAKVIQPEILKSVTREWKLQTDGQGLIKNVLSRLDLTRETVRRIMGSKRSEHGLRAASAELSLNPYLLVEQYIGDNADDRLTWSQVDRGVIPSPELGVEGLIESDSPFRLRALAYECLQRVNGHTYLDAPALARFVNKRLETLPEWKRVEFREIFLQVDADEYSGALVIVEENDQTFVYLPVC